jgi:aryl-alcohol dehydrogenase-like predicted oxidoreductase
MRKRYLGKTGLEVSEIGFGAWQLGNEDDWSGMSDATAHRLVSEAVDKGVTLFDTAPHYASTHSERLLGEALAAARSDVVLVSKFGHTETGGKDFRVKSFWGSLEGSLQRLRTDYLDVLLLHNPPQEILSGQDPIWDALDKARMQGRIRHYGASLDLAREVNTCLRNSGTTVLEVLFNIFHQDARKAFPLVAKKEMGVIAKVPLDSGWLTGRFDASHRFTGIRSRWTRDQIERRAQLVADIGWLTPAGESLTYKALAYALSYDAVSCVIPGMRTVEQLKHNVAASGGRLRDADRLRLERFWDEVTDEGRNLLPW